MTCGSLINSNAIEVRFFYPPEIPLMIGPPTSTSKHFYNFILLARVSIFLCLASEL